MVEFIEYALRTVLAFFIVLLVTQASSRQQLTKTTLFDYVSSVAFGVLVVATLITQTLTILPGLAAMSVWAGLMLFSNSLRLHSLPARKRLDSGPVIVIYNGKIQENRLSKVNLTTKDLLDQLRCKNVFDPSEVQVGILDIDGMLSLLKNTDKLAKNPATEKFAGKELIINGQIIDITLRRAGLTREWLQYELLNRGIHDMDEVVIAAITPAGKLYIDTHKDCPDNG